MGGDEARGTATKPENIGDKSAKARAQSTKPAPSGSTGGDGGGGAVQWYERAYDYWEDGDNCPVDDDGVLGGYGHISPTDIAGSAAFLDELKSMRPLLGDENAAGGGGGGSAVGRGTAVLHEMGHKVIE